MGAKDQRALCPFFSHTNPSNSRRPLQSLLFSNTSTFSPGYTAENTPANRRLISARRFSEATTGNESAVRRLAESIGLPNFIMLFQLVPTKYFQSALFLCLPKVDQVINVQKAYREMTPKRNVIRVEILTSRPCLLRELEPDNPNSYSKPGSCLSNLHRKKKYKNGTRIYM